MGRRVRDPPEQELAWAVDEWVYKGRPSLDIAAGQRFVGQYLAAGGTADSITPEQCAQLIRDRIRMEVNYSQASGTWGRSTEAADVAHEANQLRVYDQLTYLSS